MSDFLTKAERSKRMSLIKGKGNKTTELALAQTLRAARVSGWRRGSLLVGRPDFVFRREKLAVFVDGCFWHGCPVHGLRREKTRYWEEKILANIARDKRVTRLLKKAGWRVLRIWEHDLSKRRSLFTIRRIQRALARKLS